MQKINKIDLPNENCYLYSSYKDEQTKTLYLAFDNKQIIGYDSQRYTKKSNMTLEIPCMKFTEFHADPNNYVILACENGNIKIFQPSRNLLAGNFDLEQHIQEQERQYKKSMGEEIENLETQVGDIIEIVKTQDVDKTNEYMVLAKEGLFFIKIIVY